MMTVFKFMNHQPEIQASQLVNSYKEDNIKPLKDKSINHNILLLVKMLKLMDTGFILKIVINLPKNGMLKILNGLDVE